MAGLLARLATGLAVGAESYGKSVLEDQRQKRLATFRTGERKEAQTFKTSERVAGEKTKVEIAKIKGVKSDKVKKILDDEDNPGSYTTVYESGRKTYYDKTSDVERELGKGQPDVSEEMNAEATKFAEAKVDAMAKYFSSDASDFSSFEGSRDLAKQSFVQEYLKSAKAGTLDRLYKSKAPTDQARPVVTPEPAKAEASTVDKILSDFKGRANEKDILQAIINDPKMPQSARDDAQRRLGTI